MNAFLNTGPPARSQARRQTGQGTREKRRPPTPQKKKTTNKQTKATTNKQNLTGCNRYSLVTAVNSYPRARYSDLNGSR
jgi:hypothetical protein